jgi:hypothetical protein
LEEEEEREEFEFVVKLKFDLVFFKKLEFLAQTKCEKKQI